MAAYLKIDGIDFSQYVNELKVNVKHNYNAQTNAAGNTVVDYINSKREIEVGFIPLNSIKAARILELGYTASLSFLDPISNTLVENVRCIVPQKDAEYYTIQMENVMLKAFKLKFIEL